MMKLNNELEVGKRMQELREKLMNLGIYQSRDGRSLKDASIASLELTHIEAKNKFVRAMRRIDKNEKVY